MGGTGRGDCVGEGVGAVAGPVVGLDGLDVDVVGSKPAVGSAPERDRGDGAFVGEDFAVGDTAVAVDRGVDVGVSDGGVTAPGVIAAAVGSPAAPGGDATELFDVDLDQLAGSGVFDAANDPPGGPVHPRQPVESEPHQHPMHRRRMHLDDSRDSSRPELAIPTQPLDLPLEPS